LSSTILQARSKSTASKGLTGAEETTCAGSSRVHTSSQAVRAARIKVVVKSATRVGGRLLKGWSKKSKKGLCGVSTEAGGNSGLKKGG